MGRRGMSVELDYIDRFKDRHGKMRHYYRKPGSKRIALPDPSDPDFMNAYRDAEATATAPKIEHPKGAPGTFDRLLWDYYRSPDFLGTKKSSQAVTSGILDAFAKKYGSRRVATLPRRAVVAIIGSKADTPAAANNLLKKLRALMGFAIVNGWRSDDPTFKIKRFREGEHHTWTDAELAQYEAKWPLGTRERTAYAIALYTGQRRGDVNAFSRTAIDRKVGLVEVTQEKGGAKLSIPIHADLAVALDAWPAEHVMVLVSSRGKPFTVESFGNWFADAIDAAGLPERCVLHGLRKAAARRLAEVGCSAKEIASITGHKSLEEVERYTRAADQKKLARAAVKRLEEHDRDKRVPTLIPKPAEKP